MSRAFAILLKHTCFVPAWLGEQRSYNSQYFACLPSFDPYMHAICSLSMIKVHSLHLSTIYNMPRVFAVLLKHSVSFNSS